MQTPDRKGRTGLDSLYDFPKIRRERPRGGRSRAAALVTLMLDEEDADGASTILLNVGSSGLRYFSTSAADATVLLSFIQIQTKVAVSPELSLISLLHLTFVFDKERIPQRIQQPATMSSSNDQIDSYPRPGKTAIV